MKFKRRADEPENKRLNAELLKEARKSPSSDRKICGLHVQQSGQIAAVWMSIEPDTNILHVYDCLIHDREVVAVIAESLKRRGKRIPVAWHEDAEQIVHLLMDHGVNTIPKGIKHNEFLAEATARDIWERMRTQRFRVKKTLEPWLEEFVTFQRDEGVVPLSTHPLMNATLHAVAQLEWAKNQSPKPLNYTKVAIV